MSNWALRTFSASGRAARVAHLVFLLMIGAPVSHVLTGAAASSPKNRAQQPPDNRPLKAGDSVQRSLATGESHAYFLSMESGQYLQLSVEQRGIGLVVTLAGPDGGRLSQTIVPNDRYVSITLSLITKSAGEYKLEIEPQREATSPGKYELKVEALRAAAPQDADRISANRLMNEARLMGALQKSADAIPAVIEKYYQSIALWKSLGDAAGEATALGEVTGYYSGPGQAQKALDAHTRALELWRTLGFRKGEAIELSELGALAYARSESPKALDYLQQALQIHQSVNDVFGEAETLNRIGWVYRSVGELRLAMEFFNRALPLRREAVDWAGLSVTLNDLGRVSDDLGEWQKALDFYDQALALRPPEKYPSGAGTILSRQGMIYDRMGERQKALDTYGSAIRLLRQIEDLRGEAAALNNLGKVYATLSESGQALDCYERALKLCREMGMRNGEATVLGNIGTVYAASGDLQKAMEHHQQALALQQSVADRPGQAESFGNLGRDSYDAGDNQKAIDHFTQSLTLSRAIGNRRQEAVALSGLGMAYRSLGERQKALEYLNQALLIHQAVMSRRGEADALYGLAVTWAELGDFAKARGAMEEALKIVESMRSNVVSQDLRASYFATAQEYYERYVDILMKAYESRPESGDDVVALQASERMRARGLLDLLGEARIDIRQGIDQSLLEKERALRLLLDAKAAAQTRLLNGKHSEAQAAAVAKEVAELESQSHDLQAQIRAASPRYAALTEPRPLTVAEIQTQLLDDRTLLLEYLLGEKRSYLWVVSRTSVAGYPLPPRAEIERAALKVYDLLTARKSQAGLSEVERHRRVMKAEAEYQVQAAALSRLLLTPVAADLGGKRLAIVASGALEYLPFAALPDPGPEGKARTGTAPLIASHEIVNLPSASALYLIRQEVAGRPAAAKTVAALADPVFEAADSRVEAALRAGKKAAPALRQAAAAEDPMSAPVKAETELARAVRDFPSDSSRDGLSRLPFSREEAEAILALAPRGSGLMALNFQASRSTATSAELGQYRIVHFATHGLLNSEHPDLSGLVFSLIDEQGHSQDGFLRLHEIYNLRLTADLVVLSACRTGLGKQIKGEGLVGLTRGFMYAGAPRVIASLWQVNDFATAELMKRFYRGMLKDGLRPAAALRSAQLEMSKQSQWSSPYFWAAFVIQGEWR
jgi:CHAT domain-containing protein/Tfp pilus assembly protein PilF